ncbi:hypothetical protein [Glutamicibacter arilaitensis]|uniref:hypothetical protein n=1 Tax=Glutamicibacter arilaitensis TaxID=256701 RepID=UPI00384AB731
MIENASTKGKLKKQKITVELDRTVTMHLESVAMAVDISVDEILTELIIIGHDSHRYRTFLKDRQARMLLAKAAESTES